MQSTAVDVQVYKKVLTKDNITLCVPIFTLVIKQIF